MAEGPSEEQWVPEDILDTSFLFMMVHRQNYDFQKDEPFPGAFRDQGDAMSTDWDKYSTAEQTRNRAERSLPEENAVIALRVEAVRRIWDGRVLLSVDHTPDIVRHNRAHTDVRGNKKGPNVRLQLIQLSRPPRMRIAPRLG